MSQPRREGISKRALLVDDDNPQWPHGMSVDRRVPERNPSMR